MGKKQHNGYNEIGNLVQNLHQFKETENDLVFIEIYQDGSFCIKRCNEDDPVDTETILSGDTLVELINFATATDPAMLNV